ncbi:acyl-CoA dehydrogenase family protein [Sinimarinibacterium thermocellulolyticum]|uniref:Acyl-CoA dehydrogenase family protein n=1 Tax=Sinimarinibacterium thermocellulolyticum TaxID=3170016 RepID=A0ABV2A771_9GAMM
MSAAVPPLPSTVRPLLPRTLFKPEHEDFRRSVRRFIAEEISPHHERWEAQQHVDRALWNKSGEMGLLALTIPEEYGGIGADRLYSVVYLEELLAAGASGIGWPVHSDIVAPYVLNHGTEAQKRHWLPKLVSGEAVGAIAMTEPGTGSDLQGMKMRAVEDGDELVLSGSKTFITNGYLCDMVIVAAKTGDGEGAKNVSLVIVEADRPGFSKAKPLKKVGMKAQDTCELHFNDVRVPRSNVLGGEAAIGQGFIMLMRELAWERMIIAVMCVAGARTAFEHTVEYTKSRKAFGQPVASFQNSRFKLAEMRTEIELGQTYVDRCLELVLEKQLTPEAAAAAKYWCSDMMNRVIDECVQLHGGYGYMWECPVARAWADARVMRIFGGTNEIMKELISRSL